ncbi:hypothetical protein ALMP_01000 [Streptomyces sp. A012304]|nr:hypothetical protein ALMP_01000 [Streptomyces sp. A012304]
MRAAGSVRDPPGERVPVQGGRGSAVLGAVDLPVQVAEAGMASELPAGAGWAFEWKFDGDRVGPPDGFRS